MRKAGSPDTYKYAAAAGVSVLPGTVRAGIIWYLPYFLAEHGIDAGEVLRAVGLPRSAFDSQDNLIEYKQLEGVLSETARRTGVADVALQLGRHTRLQNFGVAGRAALCAPTAGAGLKKFTELFNLHSTASVVTIITDGEFARLVYAIVELGMTETHHLQYGAAIISSNLLRDVFGPQWRPVAITCACRAPANPRGMQRCFDAPLHFDCAETAVLFEKHWLDQPLPPVEPRLLAEMAAAVQKSREAILADFPVAIRRIVRRQVLLGEFSMTDVASLVSMHRRTLDRHLQQHGLRYGELVESIKADLARQLLRDTQMPIQQVAESVKFSSAANFATAFRRWSGMTPSEYRRRCAPG
jgi:AraC-like DNA-binding protein